jgi:GNAT superfamily N-acetyltransferase
MKLVDVDDSTERTFFHCLHDEAPDDPRVMDMRRAWYRENLENGLRAKVLILDTGEVVGLAQYMPIEHTHLVGRDLMAILCMWVHGYEHHVGNQQGRGYGRYILESVEEDARASGAAGVAAWGMDFPYWNPVSFYEHAGYERADRSGMAVLVWKPFRDGAVAPAFLRQKRRPIGTDAGKVPVAVFFGRWCMGVCSQCMTARDAVAGLEDVVEYMEFDTSDRGTLERWGISEGIFVGGEPYHPYEPPCTSDALRRDILDLAERRRREADAG